MKPKLFLDFDNVIVNSDKVIFNMYDKYYGHLDNQFHTTSRSNNWDYSADLPKVHENNKNPQSIIISFYKSDEFFNKLTITKEDKEFLKALNDKFQIFICSNGTQENISKKLEWCNGNIPFIENVIGLQLDPFKFGKETINMSNGILVDDKKKNLATSNASVKIHYHRGSSRTLKTLVDRIQKETGIKVLNKKGDS